MKVKCKKNYKCIDLEFIENEYYRIHIELDDSYWIESPSLLYPTSPFFQRFFKNKTSYGEKFDEYFYTHIEMRKIKLSEIEKSNLIENNY